MTSDQAHEIYHSIVDGHPNGGRFARIVGNYQEGFLRDRVTDDIEVAFARAVDTASRLWAAINPEPAQ